MFIFITLQFLPNRKWYFIYR